MNSTSPGLFCATRRLGVAFLPRQAHNRLMSKIDPLALIIGIGLFLGAALVVLTIVIAVVSGDSGSDSSDQGSHGCVLVGKILVCH